MLTSADVRRKARLAVILRAARKSNPAPGRQVVTEAGAKKYHPLQVGDTIPPGWRALTEGQRAAVDALSPEGVQRYRAARVEGRTHAEALKFAGGSSARKAPAKKAAAPQRVFGSDAAIAVGKFKPGGPDGYRAKSAPDAPLRATRAEAEADERAYWAARDAAEARPAKAASAKKAATPAASRSALNAGEALDLERVIANGGTLNERDMSVFTRERLDALAARGLVTVEGPEGVRVYSATPQARRMSTTRREVEPPVSATQPWKYTSMGGEGRTPPGQQHPIAGLMTPANSARFLRFVADREESRPGGDAGFVRDLRQLADRVEKGGTFRPVDAQRALLRLSAQHEGGDSRRGILLETAADGLSVRVNSEDRTQWQIGADAKAHVRMVQAEGSTPAAPASSVDRRVADAEARSTRARERAGRAQARLDAVTGQTAQERGLAEHFPLGVGGGGGGRRGASDARLAQTAQAFRERDRAQHDARVAELRAAQLRAEHDAAGKYSRDTVSAGDAIKVKGTWWRVQKANDKTVQVDAGPGFDVKYRWDQVTDHRAAAARAQPKATSANKRLPAVTEAGGRGHSVGTVSQLQSVKRLNGAPDSDVEVFHDGRWQQDSPTIEAQYGPGERLAWRWVEPGSKAAPEPARPVRPAVARPAPFDSEAENTPERVAARRQALAGLAGVAQPIRERAPRPSDLTPQERAEMGRVHVDRRRMSPEAIATAQARRPDRPAPTYDLVYSHPDLPGQEFGTQRAAARAAAAAKATPEAPHAAFPDTPPAGTNYSAESWAALSDHEKRRVLETQIHFGTRHVAELSQERDALRKEAESWPQGDRRRDMVLGGGFHKGDLAKRQDEIDRVQAMVDGMKAALAAAGDAGKDAPAPPKAPTAEERAAQAAATRRQNVQMLGEQLDRLEREIADAEAGSNFRFQQHEKSALLGRLSRLEGEQGADAVSARIAELRRRAEAVQSVQERDAATAAARRAHFAAQTDTALTQLGDRFGDHRPTADLVARMRANGWVLTDNPHPGSYVFESPDGTKSVNVNLPSREGQRVSFYTARGKSTYKALGEYIGPPLAPQGPQSTATARPAWLTNAIERLRQVTDPGQRRMILASLPKGQLLELAAALGIKPRRQNMTAGEIAGLIAAASSGALAKAG